MSGVTQGAAGDGDESGYRLWQARVKGTNIDGKTLLATDYLNHFNEIVMLLDMLPDMPDMIAELREWAPCDYRTHFARSTFAARDIAVAAYEHVPAAYRLPFEETVATLDRFLLDAIAEMDGMIAAGAAPDALSARVQTVSRGAQRLLDVASGIIHGSTRALDQSGIDDLLRG